MKKKLLFCAVCQRDANHYFKVEKDDLVGRCEACGHFVKFPLDADAATLKTLFSKHKDDNQGQVKAIDPATHPILRELEKI